MKLIVFLVSAWIFLLGLYAFNLGYRLSLTHEYVKLYNVVGCYRSWTIDWSYGRVQTAPGQWLTLYTWPRYYHVDVRSLLEQSNAFGKAACNPKRSERPLPETTQVP